MRPSLLVPLLVGLVATGALWAFINRVPMAEQFTEQGQDFAAARQADFARRSYNTALDYDADYTPARFQMAVLEAQSGDTQTALAMLEALEGMQPPALIPLQRGWIYYNQGQLDPATQAFAEAYQLAEQAPDDYNTEDWARIYAGLGWTSYLQGGCEAARPAFQEAYNLAPELTIAQRGYNTCQD